MDQTTVSTPDKNSSDTKEKIRHILENDPGEIPFGLTNDYMFRAVFQKNQAALGYRPEEITSCTILNPIILGESFNARTCVLDIRVCINNRIMVNVEMQMGRFFNWPKRSLYYTCSMFAGLRSGQDYNEAPPCIHIGFVSKSPFKDDQQFFSRYLLTEETSHRIFTDDFSIVMINLKHIPKGLPESDGLREIQCWARLLCAKDWKEAIHMAEESPLMQEAIVTMYELSQEQKIREQCLARILYDGDMNGARQNGFDAGRLEGRNEILALHNRLIQADRMDDLIRSISDADYRKQLMEEFEL